MASEIITINKVSKIYKMADILVTALDSVDLKINKGEFVSIIGPSGSGKSTLMHIIGLLDRPTEGEIKLEGEKIDYKDDTKLANLRNKKIGFVFQSFNLLPRTTALVNVELPLIYAGIPDSQRHELCRKVLESVNLKHRLDHFPDQLSGGERQRVAIARALVNKPSIILADEPTGNLDSRSGREILEILGKLNKEGNTIVLVTHNQDIAKMARRIIKMNDGKII